MTFDLDWTRTRDVKNETMTDSKVCHKILITLGEPETRVQRNSTEENEINDSDELEGSCARRKHKQLATNDMKEVIDNVQHAMQPGQNEVRPNTHSQCESRRELLPTRQRQTSRSTVHILSHPHVRTAWCLTEVLVGHLVQNLATLWIQRIDLSTDSSLLQEGLSTEHVAQHDFLAGR